jgi:serine/threonine protein kinase
VHEVLGRGGFGTVYRAELTGLGGFRKSVALKVLNQDVAGSDEIAQRFRDEARILGLVRHRSIVQVDGLVQLGDRWAVVMELVDGISLELVARFRPMPAGSALEVVAEVARALDVAWSAKGPEDRPLHLMHRDIKPPNIQITASGDVKVLDFGVARADFAHREAKTHALSFGSVPYMSPERLDFTDTPAGDVYALGAVLFEIITGEALGKAKGRPEVHTARVAERVNWVRENLHEGGDRVADLLESMLAYEADERPSARELERTCLLLQRDIGGLLLRDWCEVHVPVLQAEQPSEAGAEFSGSTLIENAGSTGVPSISSPLATSGSAPRVPASGPRTPGSGPRTPASGPRTPLPAPRVVRPAPRPEDVLARSQALRRSQAFRRPPAVPSRALPISQPRAVPPPTVPAVGQPVPGAVAHRSEAALSPAGPSESVGPREPVRKKTSTAARLLAVFVVGLMLAAVVVVAGFFAVSASHKAPPPAVSPSVSAETVQAHPARKKPGHTEEKRSAKKPAKKKKKKKKPAAKAPVEGGAGVPAKTTPEGDGVEPTEGLASDVATAADGTEAADAVPPAVDVLEEGPPNTARAATVRVSTQGSGGGADSVILEGATGRLTIPSSGGTIELAPGRWFGEALFGTQRVPIGHFTVQPGEQVVLRCDGTTMLCSR